MFNNHEDIIKIVEDAIVDSFDYGYAENNDKRDALIAEIKIKVQQRLEYMQSQIDELMLEYCPEEMSKEQLDNWAKNQTAFSEDECKNIDKLIKE